MNPYHIETELLIQLRNGEHNAFRRLFDLYYALMCAIGSSTHIAGRPP